MREEDKRVLVSSKEIVVTEEIHCLIVILVTRHDKHGARLGLERHNWDLPAIWFGLGEGLFLVCIELGFKESLGENLEERLLRGKTNVVLALRPIESQSTALATS